jgi:hypothetical protein
MFFVGTAPLDGHGHINISPKGMDSLRILDTRTVAYLDVTGSGVETISHLKQNGRMVMMWCAFEGRPLTLRLHGKAEALETDHPDFLRLRKEFPDLPGVRSIIRLRASRIADSCGWTVPVYEHKGSRDYYNKYAEKKGAQGMREGQLAGNMQSIDGLAGLTKPSF